MKKIIIYNEGQFDKDSKLALTSNVHVACKDNHARITKDRMGIAYGMLIGSIDALIGLLEAIYPDYEIEDCRA